MSNFEWTDHEQEAGETWKREKENDTATQSKNCMHVLTRPALKKNPAFQDTIACFATERIKRVWPGEKMEEEKKQKGVLKYFLQYTLTMFFLTQHGVGESVCLSDCLSAGWLLYYS